MQGFFTWISRPILLMTCVLHFAWGSLLIVFPGTVRFTTPLYPYHKAAELFGLILVLSACTAFAALAYEAVTGKVNALTFWAFIPQQALQMVSAGSVLYFAFVARRYASGTLLPVEFIFSDQIIEVLLALFHPLGLIRMHVKIFPNGSVE